MPGKKNAEASMHAPNWTRREEEEPEQKPVAHVVSSIVSPLERATAAPIQAMAAGKERIVVGWGRERRWRGIRVQKQNQSQLWIDVHRGQDSYPFLSSFVGPPLAA
jgi:hypothetical protein